MSISVTLKRITNLPGKYDRQVELTFRGFTHKTKMLACEYEAVFNEQFRWPHYGKQIREEMLTIMVYNTSKVFSNRLLGKLVISLQHLVSAGRLVLKEPLVDKNYSLTDIVIEVDICYHPIEGPAGTWQQDDFLDSTEDEGDGFGFRNAGYLDPQSSQLMRPERLDKEAKKLGRSLVKGGGDDDEDEDDDDFNFSEAEFTNVTFTPIKSRCRFPSRNELAASPKAKIFQVNITIVEAQKLVGVNIDPVVRVKIGDEKKHTAKQKSTNCPFYNENFMFEFYEAQETMFDRVIEISVIHKKFLPFLWTLIGMFKVDISTVYNQPEHRFYQKWAPITDPKDTRSGIKGYVKCTVSIVARGDPIGIASLPMVGSQNDDIEKNLMLPKRIPAERPWAKFCIRIYRGEGLPSMNSGIAGSFSKMMGEKKVFIDPYVKVTFAGQQGETSVESDTNAPEWNEQISFIEQFPPLARRIKVQILDDANFGDIALATHYLDLQQISDPTRNGFHPTFGPAWVNLYGSPNNSTLRDVHRDLNEGLGDGIFFRGRILLSLTVELYHSPTVVDTKGGPSVKGAISKLKIRRKSKKSGKGQEKEVPSGKSSGADESPGNAEVPGSVTVEVEEIHPLPENFLGEKEEFLLFGSLFEATMIDNSIGSKPVTFEVSIGNYGKAADVVVRSKKNVANDEEKQALLENSEDELESEDRLLTSTDKSVTPGKRPQYTEYDRSFSCVPMLQEKPCVFVWNYWEDHTWRLHNINWIVKMADRLENGIEDVEKILRRPKSKAIVSRIKEVLAEFMASCKQYITAAEKKTMTKPNALDKSRMTWLKKNINILAKQARKIQVKVRTRNAHDKLGDLRKIHKRLCFLAMEPQSTLPDVFIWMLSNNKRVAYARIPSYNVVFSMVEEEKGKDCGHIQTIYMRTPGAGLGEIFAKLEVYLWLGSTKYVKNNISSLPEDFKAIYDVPPPIPPNMPPVKLLCEDSRYFQLRAHVYQARGILAADDNGLSDPFAKAVFSTQCQTTRILEETLSPTWCELLLFDQILIEGSRDELLRDPPVICLNFYDYDKIGSPDFIGRAFAAPEIKIIGEPYKKPALQFFDITKGKIEAGELLGAFELIELDYSGYGEPTVPQDVVPIEPEYISAENYYIIPDTVRPVLRQFRIEVLFWGLRDLKRVNLFEVEKPLVKIECAGKRIESEEITDYKSNPNFEELVKYLDVELPELVYLHPPLTIFVLERRSFGRLVLVGTHVARNLMKFAPKDLEEFNDDDEPEPEASVPLKEEKPLQIIGSMGLGSLPVTDSKIPIKPMALITSPLKKATELLSKEEEFEEEEPEKEELDWWSRYYASLSEMAGQPVEEDEENEEDGETPTGPDMVEEEIIVPPTEPPKPKRKMVATLTLYKSELENDFEDFMDWLYTFILYKGRANCDDDDDDEDDRTMGKYKGSFLVYPKEEEEPESRIIQGVPKNIAVKVLIRVYVVKATDLAPTDPNGKADPYIVVKVGPQQMDTKDRYIPKQLNPVFGEVFEMTISFPLETEMILKVYDHDLVGSDDMIGETKIDLENRFYSKHRALCGLSSHYDTDGYNKWRDARKPTAILAALCRKNNIPPPEYRESEVKIVNKIFKIPVEAFPEELHKKNNKNEQEMDEMEEHKALHVLLNWDQMPEYGCRLVPEHVEVRSLMNPDKPNMPQGYVHMWVDIFPVDVPAPPPVNIKPRLPVSYELRLIIWNTDDVVLDDINPFTGEPSSDIYVKGWVKGLDGEKQETDVHFNSLTGEGNFNWRFVFRFDYLPTEKEIIYKKKESIFSIDETEFRQPSVLILQIWDYDRIGSNDFIGSIELKLNDMVRAAKSAGQCNVKMAKDKAGPRFSIFRSKRMKGWWPVIKLKTKEEIEKERQEAEEAMNKKKKKKKKDDKKNKSRRKNLKPEDVQFMDSSGNTFVMTGKIEAEFQLVTLEEAEKNPVGKARKEPEPLDKPDRPKTSFNWFVNPLKTFVFLIWKKYKKYIIALIIIAILGLFLALIVYTLPQQISQKIVQG
ncbi:fer-1-like protein 4 [Polypterus senegalus]|uniref:fer-1-like protein 4 n=1 Tax=Polypterus senegalus TaxID=55291 RepID=UPI001965A484|nr:fer-1-like protein 4 [Polypterus senegalus]